MRDPVIGAIECRDVTARANGCVPINPFGHDTASPEASAYVRSAIPRSSGIGRHGPHLAVVLELLARPFGLREAVVIKPSDIVNPLASDMLAAQPEACATALQPLPDFLRSVAGKGLFGRIWARRSYAAQAGLPAFDPGYSDQERFLHTDLQIAALG